jgi:hypothetical protein
MTLAGRREEQKEKKRRGIVDYGLWWFWKGEAVRGDLCLW